MTIRPTGHTEIDHQHAILDRMVSRFQHICEEIRQAPDAACPTCPDPHRRTCAGSLAHHTGEVLAFLVGHNTYEERLMDLLPALVECDDHVRRHKEAHADISQRLGRLAAEIGGQDPRLVGMQLYQLVRDWMGDHVSWFDESLARHLVDAGEAEVECDAELVALLDEHVFHNRPTRVMPLQAPPPPSDTARQAARARLASLTPRQQEVCGLVLRGMMNKEIAKHLGTTINTVKTHRAEVFRKMAVDSVLGLARSVDALRLVASRGPASDARAGDRFRSVPAGRNGLRVVVAETSETLRQTLVAGLVALGYQAEGVEDGAALSRASREAPIDIAILDVALRWEHEGGTGIAAQLRREQGCAIILLLAPDQDHAEDDAALPAEAHLKRPVDFSELLTAVTAIGRRLRLAEDAA
jgi:DNA-binding NarL/FixJ family response regulator